MNAPEETSNAPTDINIAKVEVQGPMYCMNVEIECLMRCTSDDVFIDIAPCAIPLNIPEGVCTATLACWRMINGDQMGYGFSTNTGAQFNPAGGPRATTPSPVLQNNSILVHGSPLRLPPGGTRLTNSLSGEGSCVRGHARYIRARWSIDRGSLEAVTPARQSLTFLLFLSYPRIGRR
jgi:hypothetical protein